MQYYGNTLYYRCNNIFAEAFSSDPDSWMACVLGGILMVIGVAGNSKKKSDSYAGQQHFSSSSVENSAINERTEDTTSPPKITQNVSEKKVCSQCGTKLIEDSIYCEECGSRVE